MVKLTFLLFNLHKIKTGYFEGGHLFHLIVTFSCTDATINQASPLSISLD